MKSSYFLLCQLNGFQALYKGFGYLVAGHSLDVEWDEMTVSCKVAQENRAGTKIFHKCNETLVALITGSIKEFSFPQNPTHAGNAV